MKSVALLAILAAICIVASALPATAAGAGDSTTVTGPGGYLVRMIKVNSNPLSPLTANGVISQGQYQWQTRNINYYTETVNYYLYWGNPSNSLRLRIFTPDGYVIGPYYDSYDGSNNGAIGVQVYRAGGVAQGYWYSEIYGDRVSGSQSYSI